MLQAANTDLIDQLDPKPYNSVKIYYFLYILSQ